MAYQRRIEREGMAYQRRIEGGGYGVSAWITPKNHISLWKQAIYALRAIREAGRPEGSRTARRGRQGQALRRERGAVQPTVVVTQSRRG